MGNYRFNPEPRAEPKGRWTLVMGGITRIKPDPARSSRRFVPGKRTISPFTLAPDECRYDLPGDRTVQRRDRNQIKRGYTEIVKTQEGKHSIHWLKSGISDKRNPESKRNPDCSLSQDTAPGNNTVIKLRPRSLKLGNPEDWIQLDTKNRRTSAVSRNHVTTFVNQHDAQPSCRTDENQQWLSQRIEEHEGNYNQHGPVNIHTHTIDSHQLRELR